jgi:hypothetical protein
MSRTNTQPAAQRGARGPAALVDHQLDHLENMVEYLSRGGAATVTHSFDHQYWEKRIRSLEETYDVVASQRQRIARLLDRLAGDRRDEFERRTAA